MSHLPYYNTSVQLNELLFTCSKDLITKVCKDLGHSDKVDDMLSKYLDKPDLKAKKDPNKPKRPKSAFLLFCDDERPKLIEKEQKNVKKGEKFNLGSIQKKLASQWKNLTETKKNKYVEQTEKEKESYYDKLTEYETSLENA